MRRSEYVRKYGECIGDPTRLSIALAELNADAMGLTDEEPDAVPKEGSLADIAMRTWYDANPATHWQDTVNAVIAAHEARTGRPTTADLDAKHARLVEVADKLAAERSAHERTKSEWREADEAITKSLLAMGHPVTSGGECAEAVRVEFHGPSTLFGDVLRVLRERDNHQAAHERTSDELTRVEQRLIDAKSRIHELEESLKGAAARVDVAERDCLAAQRARVDTMAAYAESITKAVAEENEACKLIVYRAVTFGSAIADIRARMAEKCEGT